MANRMNLWGEALILLIDINLTASYINPLTKKPPYSAVFISLLLLFSIASGYLGVLIVSWLRFFAVIVRIIA